MNLKNVRVGRLCLVQSNVLCVPIGFGKPRVLRVGDVQIDSDLNCWDSPANHI